MFRNFLVLGPFAAFVLMCCPVNAEIVRSFTVDCKANQICLYWWPKLPPLTGWHTDEAANYRLSDNGANTLVPDGYDFTTAKTIMYALAIYKPGYQKENPTVGSLSAFIEDEKASFVEKVGKAAVDEAQPTVTADGQRMRSLTYFRPAAKNWERVSYGEEGDYYLVFVINSQSEDGYRRNLPSYEKLIELYRR